MTTSKTEITHILIEYYVLREIVDSFHWINLGDVAFTAKVDGTGDAINPTSHDANGTSFTGLNVAAGHRLMVYRGGNLWFTITAQDSSGELEE